MEQQSPKQRSPWLFVGVGCGVVMLLLGISFAVIAWVVTSKFRQFGEELKDPRARNEKACRVLGCRQLPPGYHAGVSLSIPMLMEMTMLSDRPPDEDGGSFAAFQERGFLYMRFIKSGNEETGLRAYFEGKTDDPSVLRRNNINVDVREPIRRGVIDQNGQTLLYLAHRGEADINAGTTSGLQTLVLIECPGDERTRMALWFGRDPSPQTKAAELDITGTVADEAELVPFLENFRFCQGS